MRAKAWGRTPLHYEHIKPVKQTVSNDIESRAGGTKEQYFNANLKSEWGKKYLSRPDKISMREIKRIHAGKSVIMHSYKQLQLKPVHWERRRDNWVFPNAPVMEYLY